MEGKGVAADQLDCSRISPDGIEYILPTSDHVLPFFLVTYCDRGAQAQGLDPALKPMDEIKKMTKKQRKKEALPAPSGLPSLSQMNENEKKIQEKSFFQAWILLMDLILPTYPSPHVFRQTILGCFSPAG